MGVIASVQAVTTRGHDQGALMALGVALLFAAIYVLGGGRTRSSGNRGCGGFILWLPESV